MTQPLPTIPPDLLRDARMALQELFAFYKVPKKEQEVWYKAAAIVAFAQWQEAK